MPVLQDQRLRPLVQLPAWHLPPFLRILPHRQVPRLLVHGEDGEASQEVWSGTSGVGNSKVGNNGTRGNPNGGISRSGLPRAPL